MGWGSGERLGSAGERLDGAELDACEVTPYFVDRPERGGLGTAKLRRSDEEGPYMLQRLLDQLLLKCRTSQ
eukprot:2739901-Pyramimonas_sp.AAC.1